MSAASRRSGARYRAAEGNENELGTPADPTPLVPPRSPLVSIQDPSQNPREGLPVEPRLADHPFKGSGTTPKSGHGTPARAGSRVYNGIGASGAAREPVRERGCSSRGARGVSESKSLVPVEVPYFELDEDPSFWKDHNVQVLIRIRPINGVENALQGYKRCLVQESSQTLVWTGHPETRFTFDHVGCETISQEKLFKVVGMPMVDNCTSGYNSCMFAYGQTGSGKTYTMMGEICERDNILSEDCGMTPRIFEYLFTRIREEEDSRSCEQLKYSCKCSFLEIYNEQITDLLDPSATNLQLREDLKQGVYVENLKEYEVSSVKDVVELLLRGAANRKMAATNMNYESSRSHSVFTCVIESRWENDSMTHLRFGRLNLVDLAGSERQKSSGAEGERLKEAANINRSLSTLGLVIMTLVDIANGKSRHVPYRDSRLTFLLQDSLGGNSKTAIVANVSPSICSASETLSTLKFAQRAKLIQNNAKVNEDASGDVMALQRQIQKLKDQLTFLMKLQHVPSSLSYPSSIPEKGNSADLDDNLKSLFGRSRDAFDDQCLLDNKIINLETALSGALRREKSAETEVRKLEAEIKHMSRLVHLREDDAQRSKAILKLREEKLRRLELLADDLVSSEGYLMDENVALSKEIQLLRERIDRNPELTQFALENMRLVEQLRMFQNFYQLGERESLLAEVSHLRNQLLKVVEGKLALVNSEETRHDATIKELDNCKTQLDACIENNAGLSRKFNNLRSPLKHHLGFDQARILPVVDAASDNCKIREMKHSTEELILVEADFEDNVASPKHVDKVHYTNPDHGMRDIEILQFGDVQKELKDARVLIKCMESQQTRLIAELDNLKQENLRYLDLLKIVVQDETYLMKTKEHYMQMFKQQNISQKANHLDANHKSECADDTKLALVAALEKLHEDHPEAKTSTKLRDNQTLQLTWKNEMEEVQEQVEAETAKTILYLQEEIAALQKKVDSQCNDQISAKENSMLLGNTNDELNDQLCFLIHENAKISELVAAKDAEISALSDEWEKAIIDLTSFLVDGCRSLDDASEYIQVVVDSFPQGNIWVNGHVERAIKVMIEKEMLIADLQKRLEDAEQMGMEMKLKLDSLRGATLAISEVQQLECSENSRELCYLRKLLGEKISRIHELENVVKSKEDHIVQAEKNANAAFFLIKKLYDMDSARLLDVEVIKSLINEFQNEKPPVRNIKQATHPPKSEIQMLSTDMQVDGVNLKIPGEKLPLSAENTSIRTHEPYAKEKANATEEMGQVEMAIQKASEFEKALFTSCTDMEKYFADLLSDINCTYSAVRMLFHDSINDVRAINNSIRELTEEKRSTPSVMVVADNYACSSVRRSSMTRTIADGLAKINETLNSMKSCLSSHFSVCETSSVLKYKNYAGTDSHFVHRIQVTGNFSQCMDNLVPNSALIHCLMEDVESAISTITEIRIQLNMLLYEHDVARCSTPASCSSVTHQVGANNLVPDITDKHLSDQLAMSELFEMLQNLKGRMETMDADCHNRRVTSDLEFSHVKQDVKGKTRGESSLLLKFEEVQETMEDAEVVLEALLKVSDDAKCERDWWKQAAQELLAEKSVLIKELCRFEDSAFSAETKCGTLQDKIEAYSEDMLSLTSSLKESFQQIQSMALEGLNCLYSDIYLFVKELLRCIGTSRSCVEDMISEIMEKGFALLVVYQCHVGAFDEGIKQIDSEFTSQCRQVVHHEKELVHKDNVIKGLLFDLRLLQESTSNVKDMKDETEEVVAALSKVQNELAYKTAQVDNFLAKQKELEAQLAKSDSALSNSRSEIECTQKMCDILSHENTELRLQLGEAYFKNTHSEQLLEEKMKVIESLERQIISFNSYAEGNILSSITEIIDELRRISSERDNLQAEIANLNDKLEMAVALADEKEAIAVEARQVAEARKTYAEEKEEEVKILERSVEELERTINVLERKVYEMKEEVANCQLTRKALELKIQSLTERMVLVENSAENSITEDSHLGGKCQIPWQLDDWIELSGARKRIENLEMEIVYKEDQIKQYREHISELILHSEAQSSLYQEKFKALEDMVSEVKVDPSTSNPSGSVVNKTERNLARTRGSGSPFRCISNLVHQMNLEKDQELAVAKLRIEQLETLSANKQKEVCMLTARLATVDSMTHDVIRDLLGVKLDMTNYANLIDQKQLQNLLQKAQLPQSEETNTKDMEILSLRQQIDCLIEERDSLFKEINQRKADILDSQMKVEQLQQRVQLLTAQNDMLKMDKANLHKKIAEMDEMVKLLVGSQRIQGHTQQPLMIMEDSSHNFGDEERSKRRAQLERLSHVRNEVALVHKSNSKVPIGQNHTRKNAHRSSNLQDGIH